ncbi:Fe-S biogenesis protein NfuA [Candidatus Ishikawella capsulata]|uniref:Fe/S biogenesis protein NfuA n=1 Tax=Candidatus Ishikawaella capsulata Mpkobe TaxID=476281 RepID=C5WCC1_9ENTR|nr:Fe-S biogenesis protein NfuA [Candidatus Ishikawaella capsulata]BAH82977.1 predicted gluconate transport associated protein [Candidatus Ishikawaella capsulata Mpkobe]
MISISAVAQEHFIKLLANQEKGTQIRVFIINPGTIHAECGVSYCPLDTIEQTDIEIKFNNFCVYIDKSSVPYLKGAEIDLSIDNLGSQLTLKAPNAKIAKLADDDNAPLIDRMRYLINTKINPQLANHGGYVNIVEITNENYVILEFSGGCNGCSMINVTLKQGIEKELIKYFPEIKGVCDVTKHQYGQHSYY